MSTTEWHLKLGRRTLARVVPADAPGLYCQVRADGQLSLPANLSWAKNGALCAALRDHPELEQLHVVERQLEWCRSLGNGAHLSRSLAAGAFSAPATGPARARPEKRAWKASV